MPNAVRSAVLLRPSWSIPLLPPLFAPVKHDLPFSPMIQAQEDGVAVLRRVQRAARARDAVRDGPARPRAHLLRAGDHAQLRRRRRRLGPRGDADARATQVGAQVQAEAVRCPPERAAVARHHMVRGAARVEEAQLRRAGIAANNGTLTYTTSFLEVSSFMEHFLISHFFALYLIRTYA